MNTPENQPPDKDFWDAKAQLFPRYSPGEHTYEARMLALARDMGMDFNGGCVLDIGCGTGMYTLRIAMRARQVFALDISGRMLQILEEDAARLGLPNIQSVRCDWKDYSPLPPCDAVFSSMSPAFKDDASREKLLKCAGAQVLHIGFTRRMPSDVMAGLYAHFEVVPKEFNDSLLMRQWLASKSLPHNFREVDDSWDVAWQKDALVKACALTLQRHGVEEDKTLLASHIETFRREDGLYHEITAFSVGLLFWRNPA